MFAYLLSRKKRGARKDTLINLLWPHQTDDDRASATFHLTLYCLRRALEPDLKSMTASNYILYKRGRYRFDPLKPFWLDSDAFESYCHQAERHKRYGESENALLYREMAAGVYGGHYMASIHPNFTEDRYQDWCLARRQYLQELYLNALLEMAHFYCDNKEFGTCLKYAYRVLEIDPCFEEVHRLAMQCLIKSHQFDSALRQYRTCKAALAANEDRAPSGLTRRLYRELTTSLTDQ
jgi:DNA-binding SARP family transcriptional activator